MFRDSHLKFVSTSIFSQMCVFFTRQHILLWDITLICQILNMNTDKSRIHFSEWIHQYHRKKEKKVTSKMIKQKLYNPPVSVWPYSSKNNESKYQNKTSGWGMTLTAGFDLIKKNHTSVSLTKVGTQKMHFYSSIL